MNKYLRLLPRLTKPSPAPEPTTGALAAPPGIRFVPGEDVLLLTVSLPGMSAPQRRAAIAFAVEDQIARPLDEVHVTPGPECAPGRWLVGVIARAALPKDIAPGQRVLPDTLAVPIPAPGEWSVWENAGRVLIRLPDGTGLATRLPAFPVLHAAAASPALTLYAGTVPAPHRRAPLPPPALPAAFDLNASTSANRSLPPVLRTLITIASLAACGHLALLAADTFALSRQTRGLETELRTAANADAGTDTDALLTRILAGPQTATDTGFLPLLTATFTAIAAQSGTVSLRDLRFGAARNNLILTFEAAGLGALQQVETDLAAAGLTVTAGPATSANGAAEQQLTLQGPKP